MALFSHSCLFSGFEVPQKEPVARPYKVRCAAPGRFAVRTLSFVDIELLSNPKPSRQRKSLRARS
jgi:hypothetical protein